MVENFLNSGLVSDITIRICKRNVNSVAI